METNILRFARAELRKLSINMRQEAGVNSTKTNNNPKLQVNNKAKIEIIFV
jgi:hypothetical protein